MGIIDKLHALRELRRDYWLQCENLASQRPESVSREALKRLYWRWLVSIHLDPENQARPWIAYPAAEFLETLLSRHSRVFEYGAGGSTLYFAKRVAELVTVEHDRRWLEKVGARMRRQRKVQWHAHLAEPVPTSRLDLSPSDPDSYASTAPDFEGLSFENYATVIEHYPDNYFDVILIDGRARPACFKHAIAKVKFDGYIALDNAERKPYAWVEEAARRLGFDLLDFWGPGPYNRYFWRTIFLRKTRDRYALNELDVKLERYLDFDGGTFVEAGANDGVSQSNTLYFEGRRGWRGILIEPVPHLAQECRRYRPHAIVEQVALVASERNAEAVVLRYANLMSTMKGAMRTVEEEDAHIATACEVQKIETYELSAAGATLSGLLDKHNLRNVDLLCLDVEGHELNALRGLDLTRHRPRFIMVEARYRDEVHAHLSSEYELVEELSFHDLLYQLRSDTASTAKPSH